MKAPFVPLPITASPNEWLALAVVVIQNETEKAFQCELSDGSVHWFAKKCIRHPTRFAVGECDVTMCVTRWLLLQMRFPNIPK
jgi:hypothetical protein